MCGGETLLLMVEDSRGGEMAAEKGTLCLMEGDRRWRDRLLMEGDL